VVNAGVGDFIATRPDHKEQFNNREASLTFLSKRDLLIP
jgi:hypothetical protein